MKYTLRSSSSLPNPQTNHAYRLSNEVKDPAGHSQQCIRAGTSGPALPTWSDTGGNTFWGSTEWIDRGIIPTGGCLGPAPALSGWVSQTQHFGCVLRLRHASHRKNPARRSRNLYHGVAALKNPNLDPYINAQNQLAAHAHYWDNILTAGDRVHWDNFAAATGIPWDGKAAGKVNGFDCFIAVNRNKPAQANLGPGGINFQTWAPPPYFVNPNYTPAYRLPPATPNTITPTPLQWTIYASNTVAAEFVHVTWAPYTTPTCLLIYAARPSTNPNGGHAPLIRFVPIYRPAGALDFDITGLFNDKLGPLIQGWYIKVGWRWCNAKLAPDGITTIEDPNALPTALFTKTQQIVAAPPNLPVGPPCYALAAWIDSSHTYDPTLLAASSANPTSGTPVDVSTYYGYPPGSGFTGWAFTISASNPFIYAVYAQISC